MSGSGLDRGTALTRGDADLIWIDQSQCFESDTRACKPSRFTPEKNRDGAASTLPTSHLFRRL